MIILCVYVQCALYIHIPVGEGEEGHGDEQVAQPVHGGGYGDGGTAGPGGVDLGVDGPGQRAHARGKERNVEEEHHDGKRCQSAVGAAVKEPLPVRVGLV